MSWKFVFIETTNYINNRRHYWWVPHNSHFSHRSTQYYLQKFNSAERNRCLLPNHYSFPSGILLVRWPLQVVACSTDIPRQLLVKLHPLSRSSPATAKNRLIDTDQRSDWLTAVNYNYTESQIWIGSHQWQPREGILSYQNFRTVNSDPFEDTKKRARRIWLSLTLYYLFPLSSLLLSLSALVMIIIINILAPYEAIQSFWEKKLKTWEN